MKEIMDVYNWSNREIPKKVYIKNSKGEIENTRIHRYDVPRDVQFDDVWGNIPSGIPPFNEQSKINPISSVEIEQAYEIEKLKAEVKLHKDSLIKYQNRVSEYTADYTNLKDDYLNSQSENKKLQGRLNELEDVESDNLSLMKRYVNLLDKVVKLDDKKAVNNTWF